MDEYRLIEMYGEYGICEDNEGEYVILSDYEEDYEDGDKIYYNEKTGPFYSVEECENWIDFVENEEERKQQDQIERLDEEDWFYEEERLRAIREEEMEEERRKQENEDGWFGWGFGFRF